MSTTATKVNGSAIQHVVIARAGVPCGDGKTYSEATLRNAASQIMESVSVFVDEVGKYEKHVGRMVNLRMNGKALVGDLVLNAGHKMFEMLQFDAKQKTALSMSIVANGKRVRGFVIHGSVNGGGIFEQRSTGGRTPTAFKLRQEILSLKQRIADLGPAATADAMARRMRGLPDTTEHVAPFARALEGKDWDAPAANASAPVNSFVSSLRHG